MLQLMFVSFALTARVLLMRLPVPRREWTPCLVPYAIGTVAMFWVIDRVGAFWSR